MMDASIFLERVLLLSFIWYHLILFGSDLVPDVHPYSGSSRTEYISSNSSVPEGRIAWCAESPSGDTTCLLENLCYSRVLGELVLASKHISGLLPGADEQMLVYVSHLTRSVTAVRDLFETRIIIASVGGLEAAHSRVTMWRGKYMMVGRFAPGNVAHDLHDVLLPVFHTTRIYDRLEEDSFPSRTLLLVDGGPSLDNAELYDLFSVEGTLIAAKDLSEAESDLVCFEDTMVGITRRTVWYQWGLQGVPEGPASTSLDVSSEDIRMFTRYLRKRMDIAQTCPGDGDEYGILLSRKRTRRLLNGNNLAWALSQELGVNIIVLSLEKNSFKTIVRRVSCARFLAGVHGALMSLAMFLPPYAVLLEMFPYALNPKDYTYGKTLAEIPGLDLKYVTWRNMNESNTFTGSFEGIYPGVVVSKEEQERILNSSEVAPHLCCEDPDFRFRIRQDTIVDIPEVVGIVKDALSMQSSR